MTNTAVPKIFLIVELLRLLFPRLRQRRPRSAVPSIDPVPRSELHRDALRNTPNKCEVSAARHWIGSCAPAAYASESSVNSSCGCATPRSAYRPTETRRRFMPPTAANAEDIRTG